MNLDTPQEIADLINLDVEKSTDEFNELIRESLSGIADKLTEDDCCQIIEIRNEFADLVRYCVFFSIQNPIEYNGDYFKSKFTVIIEKFYNIVLDYYIDDDIAGCYNLNEVINDLNDAKLLSSKVKFKIVPDNFKHYIYSALHRFTTKQTSQANQLIIANLERPFPVSEVLETKAESLNKKLSEYGFFELDKVKDVEDKKGFVELLAADKGGKGKSCSYIIAMFDSLGFIKKLQDKYVTNNKKVLYNTLTKITGFEPESIKKNINNIDKEHKLFKSYSYKNVVKEDLNTYIHTN